MSIAVKPLIEINQKAIGILYKEICIVNTIRFINQFTTGYGNYTKEREQMFDEMTVNDIISDIALMRLRDV